MKLNVDERRETKDERVPVKKLGEVCDYPNQRIAIDDLSIGEYVGVEHLVKNRGGLVRSEQMPDAENAIEFIVGDVLIGNIRPYLRKIWLADFRGGASGDVVVVRVKNEFADKILPKYLYKVLASDKFFDYDNNNTKGAKMPRGDRKAIAKYPIPVPPLSEQSRIVAELDLLTGIIDKQNAQLKELDNLAQSIFYDMFGDPIENPKGWEVQLLKQHTTKIGSGATPKGGNESYKSEGIPLIRSLNVYNGTFKYKDLAHIDENQAAALDNVILQGGDVLLNITGASVARCCIVPCDLVSGRVNQHVAILRPKDSLKSVFLCAQLISSGYQQKLLHDSKANGATREALTKSQLEGLPIILPPLALQQSFAEKIQSIEKQKETIRASIADTQKLLDYTMDKYFG